MKRQAVGALSFESFAIRHDGTMIYGDELAPSGGTAGGGIYKFVPTVPYAGTGPPIITQAQLSPLAAGSVFGLRVAANNNSTNWGQGAEIGKGRWVAIDKTLQGVVDAFGNIVLRTAQVTRSSPATTGQRTWTSIRLPRRTASSAPAGPTPAA